jgi:hypothetical protein
MAEGYKRLRIQIAGNWSTDDFRQLFTEMEDLHLMALFALTRIDGQTAVPFRFRRSRPHRYETFWYDPEFQEQVQDTISQIEVRHFIHELVGFHPPLRVAEIIFSSPGHTDLVGMGKIIEEIRKFIIGVTDRYLYREDRELDREHKRQTILKEKLANTERFLKIADKTGLDTQTKNEIIRHVLGTDYYLESKVIEGQITEVEELEDEPPEIGH